MTVHTWVFTVDGYVRHSQSIGAPRTADSMNYHHHSKRGPPCFEQKVTFHGRQIRMSVLTMDRRQ